MRAPRLRQSDEWELSDRSRGREQLVGGSGLVRTVSHVLIRLGAAKLLQRRIQPLPKGVRVPRGQENRLPPTTCTRSRSPMGRLSNSMWETRAKGITFTLGRP